MEEKIRFELNGKQTEILLDPDLTLLWVLRNKPGLTGTKYGCGMGFCGACVDKQFSLLFTLFRNRS